MTTLTQNSVITLHELSQYSDGEILTVGRIDTNEFIELPVMAGLILNKFDGKKSIADITALLNSCGHDVDVLDFAHSLLDLKFVHQVDGVIIDEKIITTPGRFLPLFKLISRFVFSRPAIVFYVFATFFCLHTLIVEFSVVSTSVATSGKSVVITMLCGIFLTTAALIVHESFHALAMIREGLPVSFKLSTRLFWLVVEADMNALYSLPRQNRYLPIFAGLCADVTGLFTALLLIKFHLMSDTAANIVSVFIVVQITAIASQLLLNIRTDLYYVLANVLKSTSLDGNAKLWLKSICGNPLATAEYQNLPAKEKITTKVYCGIFLTCLVVSVVVFAFYQAPFLAGILATATENVGRLSLRTLDFWASLGFLGIFSVGTALWLMMTLRRLLPTPVVERA